MILKRKWEREFDSTHKFLDKNSLMAPAAEPIPILNLEIGSFYIPKSNPSKPLGEDAHFVFSNKQTVGVADGVGGWASKGIDAGQYARDFMRNCVASLADAGAVVNPRRVMTEAHSRTTVAGSSTACIISFDGLYLRAANLGDSGFVIFRNGEFFYRSPSQRKGFNRPYQLGTSKGCDLPAEAWSGRIRAADGDIIVLGTDGLWDNVFAEEIQEILAAEVAAETMEDLAVLLAELALYNSMDKLKHVPFTVEAREAGRSRRGGKIDDITVIVLKVSKTSFSSS